MSTGRRASGSSAATLTQIADVLPLHSEGRQRKQHVRLSADAKKRLKDELSEMEAPGTADYRKLAERYNISLRAVERIVTQVHSRTAPRSQTTNRVLRHKLPDNCLDMVAAFGTRKQAWKYYLDRGAYCGDYTSFTRQLNSQIGANTVTGACKGVDSMRFSLSEKLDRRPFMSAYTVDLFHVRAPLTHRNRSITPFGILVREDHTDTIVNAHIFDTDEVNAAMIASVIGQAFRGKEYTLTDPQGADQTVFVGGLPDFIYCDNEAKFVARALDDMLAGLGTRVLTINSYASNENGAHERLHRTLRMQLLSKLPQSTNGKKDKRGQLMDGRAPLGLTTARELLQAWVYRSNSSNRKGARAPLEAWVNADPEQLTIRRPAGAEIAHLAFEHPETCQRYKLGVRLDNEHYFVPELTNFPGKRFTVRRWFGDPDHVELLTADGRTRVGTATRNGAHTAAESQEISSHRADQERDVTDAIERGEALDPIVMAELARHDALPLVDADGNPVHDAPDGPTAWPAGEQPRVGAAHHHQDAAAAEAGAVGTAVDRFNRMMTRLQNHHAGQPQADAGAAPEANEPNTVEGGDT